MKDLLEKIGSYNLLNFLLPGVVFAALIDALTPFTLLQKDIIVGAFVYYFLGAVVSRTGSVVIEPILRRSGLVEFAKYNDFISAEKSDPKLSTLVEVCNMYRTFCALIFVVACVLAYGAVVECFPKVSPFGKYLVGIALMILFMGSYRKQSQYISERVKAAVTPK